MKTLATILLSSFSLLVFGQSGADRGPGISRQQLVGVWQEGSTTVGDALKKNFQFFTDGHFVLNFSQYDDIGTVRALGGKYKLDSGGLYLIAEYRKEIVGGTYEKGNPGVDKDEFVLNGGKLTVIRQKPDSDSYVDPYIVSPCKSEKRTPGHACILINYNTYYKISNAPGLYEKNEILNNPQNCSNHPCADIRLERFAAC